MCILFHCFSVSIIFSSEHSVHLQHPATMVDRTVYAADKTPDLPLRQVFGRQRVNEDLCKLAANSGLLTVETFAMLGDDISSVKATLKNLVPDLTALGADGPAQELALTCLAAVWKTCSTMQDHFAARRAKMEEDPSKKFRAKIMRNSERRSSPGTLTCSFHYIGSPTASSWSESSEIIWFTDSFMSMRWGRSAPATSRSLRKRACPRMPRICCG